MCETKRAPLATERSRETHEEHGKVRPERTLADRGDVLGAEARGGVLRRGASGALMVSD